MIQLYLIAQYIIKPLTLYKQKYYSKMTDSYEQAMKQSRQLAQRMRNGTGASNLLHGQDAPTHYIDTLQRFQKDYAAYDKQKRQQQKKKRQEELQRKRIQHLQRQNRRWQMMENYDQKLKQRQQQNVMLQRIGLKRTANSNGLAYNPINLQYEKNPEGQRLKYRDEDAKIRSYVRAHNMDNKGNCKYNPINGDDRMGIQKIVPQQLNQRYQHKLFQHYDNLRLKVPSSSNSIRSNGTNKFY